MDLRVKAAIGMMQDLISDEISVQAVSQRVNLSPARLRELFAQNIGQSPIQYLKDLRMRRAEHLLQTTFLSVKQVTHLVGINDVSHFVRDFKKRKGMTPSDFRADSSGAEVFHKFDQGIECAKKSTL